MRLITKDDIIDVYCKGKQRGVNFILSKLNIKKQSRTKSAFNHAEIDTSNWWNIPAVNQRWNEKITGKSTDNYKDYIVKQHLKGRSGIKLISLGSGSCGNELELASNTSVFAEITCVDIGDNRLKEAEKKAKERNLTNIKFICADIKDIDLPENSFDIVFFNASLHHFDNIKVLILEIIKKYLKPSGNLIINEYVGPTRLQFPSDQINAINKALRLIPIEHKQRYKTNLVKNKYSGSGIIRMILADPSECIDSESIMPSIHSNFKTIYERPYGGNILMSALKDISHHFITLNPNKSKVLSELFEFEDEYLKTHSSDFVFGIYEKTP